MSFESESLGLDGDGPSTSERVEDRWWIPFCVLKNRISSLAVNCFIVCVLPLHDSADNSVQSLALELLRFLSREQIGT